MVKQITRLTNEQRDRIPEWTDMWTERLTCTDPADRESFERGCKACYEYAGLKWHDNVIWVDNPLLALTIGPFAAALLQTDFTGLHAKLAAQLSVATGRKLASQVSIAVRNLVLANGVSNIRNLVGVAVNTTIKEIKYQLLAAVNADRAIFDRSGVPRNPLGEHFASAVHQAVQRQLPYNLLREYVADRDSRSELRAAVSKHWHKYFGGTCWLTWQAYESFFDEVCHLEHDKLDQARAYRLTQQSAGHWWPHENFVIVSERPTAIHGTGVLHCDNGPALAYRNWELWYINGVAVNQKIVMRPETQSIKEIDTELNADVRSIRIERFGWTRYLKESQATCIDSRKNLIEGTHEALYRTTHGDKRLVAVCPTGRIFAMGVPPEVMTCRDAKNWLADDEEDDDRVLART